MEYIVIIVTSIASILLIVVGSNWSSLSCLKKSSFIVGIIFSIISTICSVVLQCIADCNEVKAQNEIQVDDINLTIIAKVSSVVVANNPGLLESFPENIVLYGYLLDGYKFKIRLERSTSLIPTLRGFPQYELVYLTDEIFTTSDRLIFPYSYTWDFNQSDIYVGWPPTNWPKDDMTNTTQLVLKLKEVILATSYSSFAEYMKNGPMAIKFKIPKLFDEPDCIK